jgi:hypothetical protein
LRHTGLGHVLRPLAIGLALCALGLWAGLVYRSNQAALRAQAVPARAVIDQIYGGPLRLPGPGAPEVFDQSSSPSSRVLRTRHARWRELTEAYEAAAVAELREVVAGCGRSPYSPMAGGVPADALRPAWGYDHHRSAGAALIAAWCAQR